MERVEKNLHRLSEPMLSVMCVASGMADYGALKLKAVERSSPLVSDEPSADREYHLKIKGRFDPCAILPDIS